MEFFAVPRVDGEFVYGFGSSEEVIKDCIAPSAYLDFFSIA